MIGKVTTGLSNLSLTYGRFKLGKFFVSGQKTVFWGKSLLPPDDVAQHVIAVANHVISVAYSHDRCCQRHLKEIWRPDRK